MRTGHRTAAALLATMILGGLTLAAQTPGEATPPVWGDLKPGPYAVGFKLAALTDESRDFSSNPQVRGVSPQADTARTVRVYQWYPAQASEGAPLRIEDYVRAAAADFDLLPEGKTVSGLDLPLPVPLAQGFSEQRRRDLLRQPTLAFRDAEPAKERFPLVILGQGLYYESPLSQVVLAEYLASHGYVVATCPLTGTYTRLVNLRPADLETAVRDLEFVLARASALPYVDRSRLGVVGYDLGGMAGLLLSMRNPRVGAFVSMDSGILARHFSGLPQTCPEYDESRFGIPWLHAAQARVAPPGAEEERRRPLWLHKAFGDSYLLLVNTTCHGDFSSYAMFGPESAVPNYWGPVQGDPRKRHGSVCQYVLRFLDAYLKKDPAARDFLKRDVKQAGLEEVFASVEFKAGAAAPPYPEDYVQAIILHGADEVLPGLRKEISSGKCAVRWDEGELNWLGYHFLYWWGREKEAVEVFRLNTELFPQSANAFDSLGEACMALGDKARASENYRKSLQLDPKNDNARQMLEQLEKK